LNVKNKSPQERRAKRSVSSKIAKAIRTSILTVVLGAGDFLKRRNFENKKRNTQ
jgi:DNA-binding GntR family transcriptional regulator